MDEEQLLALIKAAPWRDSQEAGPHQYITVWQSPDLWNAIVLVTRAQGYKGEHLGKTYKYVNVGQHKYWMMWPVLNRALLPQPEAQPSAS